jgi:hypothetical protein
MILAVGFVGAAFFGAGFLAAIFFFGFAVFDFFAAFFGALFALFGLIKLPPGGIKVHGKDRLRSPYLSAH